MSEIKAVASGQLEFKITVQGKAPNTTEPGQTAFSHLGINPIAKAIVVYDALMALTKERVQRIRHPLIESKVGRSTNLHISRIQCGEMRKYSRISETCILGGAISFPPGETLEDVKAEICACIELVSQADDWLSCNPPVISWVTGVTGAEIADDHPLYVTASSAVRTVTGFDPHINPMHTSSDIRNPIIEAGIPCVGLGCLGGDLSQNDGHDEWVDLNDYLRMVDVTERVVTSWCQGHLIEMSSKR